MLTRGTMTVAGTCVRVHEFLARAPYFRLRYNRKRRVGGQPLKPKWFTDLRTTIIALGADTVPCALALRATMQTMSPHEPSANIVALASADGQAQPGADVEGRVRVKLSSALARVDLAIFVIGGEQCWTALLDGSDTLLVSSNNAHQYVLDTSRTTAEVIELIQSRGSWLAGLSMSAYSHVAPTVKRSHWPWLAGPLEAFARNCSPWNLAPDARCKPALPAAEREPAAVASAWAGKGRGETVEAVLQRAVQRWRLRSAGLPSPDQAMMTLTCPREMYHLRASELESLAISVAERAPELPKAGMAIFAPSLSIGAGIEVMVATSHSTAVTG